MMNFCPNCGNRLSEGMHVCPNCGIRLDADGVQAPGAGNQCRQIRIRSREYRRLTRHRCRSRRSRGR